MSGNGNLRYSREDPAEIGMVGQSVNVVHKPGKVSMDIGRKKLWALTAAENGTTHTVLTCVSAPVNVVAPMLIYPRKRLSKKLMKGAVSGSLFACSDNGWITQDPVHSMVPVLPE